MRTRFAWWLVYAVELHGLAFLAVRPDGPAATPQAAETPVLVEDASSPPLVAAPAQNAPVTSPLPAPRRRPVKAPPPAAAASAVASPDVGEPLPVGSASAYPGGVTAPDGTGLGYGGLGGGGLARADLSRPARLGGQVRWSCPWPDGAPDDGRVVTVRVAVEVDADGTPLHARVTDDPGRGFGGAARDCAMQWPRYVAGRGPDGRVARAWTESFRVVFDPWYLVPKRTAAR